MLSYFPEIYPGELLYSVVARYRRHSGLASVSSTNRTLFGRANVRPAIDLRGPLQPLAERLRLRADVSGRGLADRNTLFNYYSAFAPGAVRREMLRRMLTGAPKAPTDDECERRHTGSEILPGMRRINAEHLRRML